MCACVYACVRLCFVVGILEMLLAKSGEIHVRTAEPASIHAIQAFRLVFGMFAYCSASKGLSLSSLRIFN